jgi:hypothetical protein
MGSLRIAIMQPYFLPYLSYFQLENAVDKFIYYDDVTFIKQGWINRNYILLNNQDFRFTLELRGASSYKKINDIGVGGNRMKLYKTFVQAYSKAPYFKDMDRLLFDIFYSDEQNLFNYIIQTHLHIFNYLGLDTNHLDISSTIDKDCSLKGKEKVLNICKRSGATTYINAIGGKELYSKDEFKTYGIELLFLHSSDTLPKRSIIDVLMNHSKEEIITMLKNYTLE